MQESVSRLRLGISVQSIPNRSAKICNNRIPNQICDKRTGMQIFFNKTNMAGETGEQLWTNLAGVFMTKWNHLNNLSQQVLATLYLQSGT